MLNLIPDEEVAVIRDFARLDDLGEPIDSQPSRKAVRCVVCPGSTSDLGAERPNVFPARAGMIPASCF